MAEKKKREGGVSDNCRRIVGGGHGRVQVQMLPNKCCRWFSAARKHRMFLPCGRNILCFLETKIDVGNNFARTTKLGNIGGTYARYACFWKHVSTFCQAFTQENKGSTPSCSSLSVKTPEIRVIVLKSSLTKKISTRPYKRSKFGHKAKATHPIACSSWPSIKPGTWNILEHPGTSRNIPKHHIIIIIMRKICKITFSKLK